MVLLFSVRSRVLMSTRESDEIEYGPATPFSYKDLFIRWFQVANEIESSSDVVVMEPSMPSANIAGDQAPEPDVNHTEHWPVAQQPQITADIPDNKVVVDQRQRQINATA